MKLSLAPLAAAFTPESTHTDLAKERWGIINTREARQLIRRSVLSPARKQTLRNQIVTLYCKPKDDDAADEGNGKRAVVLAQLEKARQLIAQWEKEG